MREGVPAEAAEFARSEQRVASSVDAPACAFIDEEFVKRCA